MKIKSNNDSVSLTLLKGEALLMLLFLSPLTSEGIENIMKDNFNKSTKAEVGYLLDELHSELYKLYECDRI